LDPTALGAIYKGRASFREPSAVAVKGKQAAASREAVKRQTIAQRKAAESAAQGRTKGKES